MELLLGIALGALLVCPSLLVVALMWVNRAPEGEIEDSLEEAYRHFMKVHPSGSEF